MKPARSKRQVLFGNSPGLSMVTFNRLEAMTITAPLQLEIIKAEQFGCHGQFLQPVSVGQRVMLGYAVIPVSYTHLADWAGAGATVPLLGFGNTLWKGVWKSIGEDGFLGIFEGGFTASAVGISGALIFGYIGSLIFKPKMKK